MPNKLFALALVLIATSSLTEPALAIRMQNTAQIDSQFGISMPSFVKNDDALAVMTNLA